MAKTYIVTGGTSGMGEAIVKRLAEQRSNIVFAGRNKEKGLEIQRECGKGTLFFEGDISKPETNKQLAEYTLKQFGSIDHIVFSAGRLGVGKLHELEIEDWHKTISTNLNSIFYLLKYTLPELVKSGSGSVVIIGSVASMHAFPNHPAYAASKSALTGLVKQLALDYGPEVRINMISPAQVDTPLLRNSVEAFENPETIIEETEQKLPLKRLGTVKDISNAVLYLLGEESGWVTGTNLVIDGGFTV